MTTPPPYPRVGHLVPGRGTRDDVALDAAAVQAFLGREVVVEEKLDGANVSLWLEDGVVACGLRSGVDAMDRAGQLGPLRAWVAQHDEALRRALAEDRAIYAEWLLLSHSVGYDRLPSYLVVLDLWRAEGFATPQQRNEVCAAAGLPVPPEVWRGVPGSVAAVEKLLGPSSFGPGPMEGLVVRTVDGGRPRLAKLLRPGFDQLDDAEWRRGRPHNRLQDAEASWR